MMKRVAASLVVLLMLPTIAAAPSSPRGTPEDILGDATAILREATDPQQAWGTVQGFAARWFDGRLAARRTLGASWAACAPVPGRSRHGRGA